MRVKKAVAPKKRECILCLENLSLEELQRFHLDHRLHLACRECIKQYLESLPSAAIIRCPYCRLPVDSILYNYFFVNV